MLGIAPRGNLLQFESFEECDKCNGEGKVLTGSHVPEYLTRNCPTCQGTGYRERGLAPAVRNGETPEVHPAFTEQPAPIPEDEAWIEHARAAGYTIVPPMPQYVPSP